MLGTNADPIKERKDHLSSLLALADFYLFHVQ